MTTITSPARGPRGFTLVEILIVLVLVGFLSIVTIPAVNSISPFVLDQSVAQVERALRFARDHARAMNAPVIVRFDNAARKVQLTRMEEGAVVMTEVPVMHPLTKAAYIVALGAQPLTATSMQLRAEFTFMDGSKAPNVTFDSNGVAGRISSGNAFIPIKETGIWRGLWRSSEVYAAGDWIEHNGVSYDCLSSHTAAGSFASDLSRWKVRTIPGQVTVSANGHQRLIFVEPSWGFIRVQSK